VYDATCRRETIGGHLHVASYTSEPGIRPGNVARKLGIPRSSVTRALPAMDEAGMLLSEDRRGGLWPWKK
jgi:DNA-binding IclR family transcriptional regulator